MLFGVIEPVPFKHHTHYCSLIYHSHQKDPADLLEICTVHNVTSVHTMVVLHVYHMGIHCMYDNWKLEPNWTCTGKLTQ